MVLRRRKVVALARAHEGDDGDTGGGGGVELEEAPWVSEHSLGLEKHDHVRVEDVADEQAEVAEFVRICGQV